jgi:hypothetical protein
MDGLRENLCRPYGTQFHFPFYPALRLRLRAELSSSAPTALVFRATYSSAKTPSRSHANSEDRPLEKLRAAFHHAGFWTGRALDRSLPRRLERSQ